MSRFLFSFGIPGVITFFLTHKVFEDKFGIMGAVWCFSFLFLALDSLTQTKWNKEEGHYEKEELSSFPRLHWPAIIIIVAIPVLVFGFHIHF